MLSAQSEKETVGEMAPSEKLSDGEEAGPSDYEEEEGMSDAEENCSDDDDDELGGTRVNVDITRALRTLREGTFEGVANDYASDDAAGTSEWRAQARGSCVGSTSDRCVGAGDSPGNEAPGVQKAAAAEASAASTPDNEQQGGRFVGSIKGEEGPDCLVQVQGAVVLTRAPSSSSGKPQYQHSFSPRPLTDARIIAEAHAPEYAPFSFSRSSSNASGDEYGFYAQGEVQRITADDGFDLEEALVLQEGGLFTDRQRRWMKIPDGDPGPCSPCARPASALPSKQRKGKKNKWRSPFWVPFSVIVAALPACDSPQVPMARAQQDDSKRKHMEAKVAECERAAAKAVAQGRFMGAIEAVENNIRHRARGGLESPSQLLCMLQATAFLCGAYAVECIHRKQVDEAELLLEHAESLTRKGVLKKCRETDLVRCGLRAATFNVNALLHRQMGEHSKSFRMLQRALKIARQKQGLEVMEAATLTNMGSVLMSQGQLPDAITIVGASLSLLSKHELEAARAWESEVSLHQYISSGDVPSTEAGGRAGRSARINAIWAMVAMSHHNRGAMHEAAKRSDVACHNYERALEIAHQYLGPSSHTATVISAALSAQQPGSPRSRGASDKLQPTPEKKLSRSGGRPPVTSTSADGDAPQRSTRRRPDPVQVEASSSWAVVRSPDSVHRTLVESCGYVHWGHAPTGLRHKQEKEERLKNGANNKAGAANGAILPTLLYFNDSPRIDGLGLPAPLLHKGANSSGVGHKKPSGSASGGNTHTHAGMASGASADEGVVRADADLMGRAGPRKYRSSNSLALVRSLSCPVSESTTKAVGGSIERCTLQTREASTDKKTDCGVTKHLPQVKKTLPAPTDSGAPPTLTREKTPLHNPPVGTVASAVPLPDEKEPCIQRSLSANFANNTVMNSKPVISEVASDGGWGAGGAVGRETGQAVQRALEKRPAMLNGNGALFNALAFPSAGGGSLCRGKEGGHDNVKKSQPSWGGVGTVASGRAMREVVEVRNDDGDYGKRAKTVAGAGGKAKGSQRDESVRNECVEETLSFLLGRGSCGALRISTAVSVGKGESATPAYHQHDAPQAGLSVAGAASDAQPQQPAWTRVPSTRSDTSRPGTSCADLLQREGDNLNSLEREADERVRRLLGEANPEWEPKTYHHAVQGRVDGSCAASRDRFGVCQLALTPLDSDSSDVSNAETSSHPHHSHQPQAQRHARLRVRPQQQQQQQQQQQAQYQPSGFSQWCGRGNGPGQLVPRPPATSSGGKDEKQRRNGVETVQLLLNRVNKTRGNADAQAGGIPAAPMQCDSMKTRAEDVDMLRIVCSRQQATDAREGVVRASWHAGLEVHRGGDAPSTVRGVEERGDSARREFYMKSRVGSQRTSAVRVLPDVLGAASLPDVHHSSIARSAAEGGSRQQAVRASLPR